MDLKKGTIVLLMAISSISAYEIDVVNCRSVLKNDPPPSDKILDIVYSDIEMHPNDFVCAYNACDFSHTEGWFAIKKSGLGLFRWNKEDGTTTNIYYDNKVKELVKVNFNKYGVRNTAIYKFEWMTQLIDILMSGVQQCSN